jgi:hypothetical protein
MRKILIGVGVAAAALALTALAIGAPSNDDELLPEEQHRLAQATKTFEGGAKGGSALNMEVVGHNDLGGRGFNGDVWEHEGYAYIGHWGFQDWASGSKNRFCPEEPNNGIAVVDARNPASPVMVSRLQNPAGTSAEDMVVHEIGGRDIAVGGIQVCGGSRYDTSFFRGLILWDVTNPATPVEIGRIDTGCCTRGVHEFEIADRPDLGKTFAYATVPFSELPDSLSPTGVRDQQGRGDFRLIDITNPASPVEVSNWGLKKNLGQPVVGGQGCFQAIYDHGAEPSNDGKTVFLSYWDAGYVALDVANPAAPVFKGKTTYPANADGDAHSASYDDTRRLLFTADEDFCPNSGPSIEKGWGYLRVFDFSKIGSPKQIGEFRTENSLAIGDPAAGDYTIHNPVVVGTDVYISWYSDGVRVVDARNPRAPKEVAYFVPPAGKNPVKPSQRFVLSNTPQVWGVVVDEAGLVYASDMNTGLWILRRTK